jgi:20S proteasome subunit alpha 3
VSALKQELKEDEILLANAQDLSIKILSKTLDMTKLTSEKGEKDTAHSVDENIQ